MTAERAVMLVKKVTYFGEFGYLNSSCIRKRIILMFLSSSREQFTLLKQNSVIAVSVGFRPPRRCPSRFGCPSRIADVTLRDSHVVARANERRLYSQANYGSDIDSLL